MAFIPKVQPRFFPKRNIIIHLTTGGTIDTKNRAGGGRRPEGGLKTLADVPNFLSVRLVSRDSFALDSSNIGTPELQTIYQGVVRSLGNKKPICIAHGTDSMETTAQILSFSLNPYLQMPVVLFGSHSSPDAPGSDAAQNFLNTLLLCGNPTTPPFVYVVFGKDIHLGSMVQKIKTMPNNDRQYFVSRGRPVGQIEDSGEILFSEKFLHWAANYRKTSAAAPSGLTLAEVSVLSAFREFNPRILEDRAATLLPKLKQGEHPAIVLASEFSPFAFRSAYDQIGQTTSRGLLLFGQGLPPELGAINLPAHLSPEQIQAKAMVTIGRSFPYDRNAVLAEMTSDLSGEIVLGEPTAIPYQETLRVEPNTSASDLREATARLLSSPGYENKFLVIEGLGDGHLRLFSDKTPGNIHPSSSERVAAYAANLIDLLSKLIRDANPANGRTLLNEDELSFYSELLTAGTSQLGFEDREQKMFSTILDFGQEQVQAIHDLLRRPFVLEKNLPDLRALLVSLLKDEIKVDRFIRNALIDSSEHLQAIAEAIEAGVVVLMMTRVHLSQANMNAYDIGQMIQAIGVEEVEAVTPGELQQILELRVSGQRV